MNKRKQHITALILLLIFAFPIAYQSVHILNNHGHTHETESVVSSACCSHNLLLDNCAEEEYCPICDYEFSHNELAESVFIRGVYQKFVVLIVAKNSFQYSNNKESSISPRAPPAYNQILFV